MDDKVDNLSDRITMNHSYSLLPLKISGIRVLLCASMVLSAAQPGDINTVQYKHSGQPAVAGDKAGLYYQCWVT